MKSKWTKIATVVGVAVLFFLSFGLTKFIGGEFFAKIDKGEFLVQIEMPKDASVEVTNQMTRKAEAYLAKKTRSCKNDYHSGSAIRRNGCYQCYCLQI